MTVPQVPLEGQMRTSSELHAAVREGGPLTNTGFYQEARQEDGCWGASSGVCRVTMRHFVMRTEPWLWSQADRDPSPE